MEWSQEAEAAIVFPLNKKPTENKMGKDLATISAGALCDRGGNKIATGNN